MCIHADGDVSDKVGTEMYIQEVLHEMIDAQDGFLTETNDCRDADHPAE